MKRLRIARRVLVVEDHQDTAHIVAKLLQRHGHEPHVVGTLADAECTLRDSTFDVVFCDLGLPDGDGSVLPRAFKAAYPLTKFIAVTGFGMPEDVLKIEAAGFHGHVLKPCVIDA